MGQSRGLIAKEFLKNLRKMQFTPCFLCKSAL